MQRVVGLSIWILGQILLVMRRGRVTWTIRLCYSLALADDAALWVAVVGYGGVWMSWEARHAAVGKRLRYSLALAGDAGLWSAVAGEGGVRTSVSPPHAAARLTLARVFCQRTRW